MFSFELDRPSCHINMQRDPIGIVHIGPSWSLRVGSPRHFRPRLPVALVYRNEDA